MKKEHYIFLIGGEIIGRGNFIRNKDAREYAKQLSEVNRYAFVGYYKMISAVSAKK